MKQSSLGLDPNTRKTRKREFLEQMEEAFFDTPLFRQFAQFPEHARVPDESTILRFRHRLEKHRLAEELFKTGVRWTRPSP